jgi:hypothetical protein
VKQLEAHGEQRDEIRIAATPRNDKKRRSRKKEAVRTAEHPSSSNEKKISYGHWRKRQLEVEAK